MLQPHVPIFTAVAAFISLCVYIELQCHIYGYVEITQNRNNEQTNKLNGYYYYYLFSLAVFAFGNINFYSIFHQYISFYAYIRVLWKCIYKNIYIYSFSVNVSVSLSGYYSLTIWQIMRSLIVNVNKQQFHTFTYQFKPRII